jgi:transposase-like protein
MGLSRRQFTREFKLAALQRLETGASVAEVARAFEVNPNVLHRWRREFRQGPGNAFPGLGQRSCVSHPRGQAQNVLLFRLYMLLCRAKLPFSDVYT